MSAGHSIYEAFGSYKYVAAAGASATALGIFGCFIRYKTQQKLQKDDVLPDNGISLFNIATEIVGTFRSLLKDLLDKKADTYLPFVLGTFLLILVNNLSGMIPGLISPSENLINNLSMAVVVFVLYQALGFKEHGIGYLRHFMGGLPPPGFGFLLTAFMAFIGLVLFVIETIGHVVRPVSLSFRLFGTITGDHALFMVSKSIFPLLLPIIAMVLGLLVSVIQAFVFSLLSTVYIKLAVSHDH